jgi:hypothetical protein
MARNVIVSEVMVRLTEQIAKESRLLVSYRELSQVFSCGNVRLKN